MPLAQGATGQRAGCRMPGYPARPARHPRPMPLLDTASPPSGVAEDEAMPGPNRPRSAIRRQDA